MVSGVFDLASTEAPDGSARVAVLRRFLEAYWLRPENALWMTLRSMTLRGVESREPFADIFCGDGVFCFLHFGGEFHPDFDVFHAVEHLDRVHHQHADMFDGGAGGYRPIITRRPPHSIAFGVDHKPTMLAKAGALGIYERLIEQDGNRRLPIESGTVRTAYCNAAYWIRAIDDFLADLARITHPDGRVVLQVKLEGMRRFTLERFRPVLGDRFLDIIGRGRMACWPTLADRSTWESRFLRAGFDVVSATPFVTRTHAHLWDVGLRPLAPLLVRMANALEPGTRSFIKKDWVDLLMELLLPMLDPFFDLLGDPDPAEMQYVLTPRTP